MMLRMHIVDTRFQTAELYFPHSQAVRKFPSVQELPGLTRGGLLFVILSASYAFIFRLLSSCFRLLFLLLNPFLSLSLHFHS
eukprot:m.13041 g.13041  ORF g.13041 m.13041 type:complete len:82 (-) comp18728_c0_seq1:382-627(-)